MSRVEEIELEVPDFLVVAMQERTLKQRRLKLQKEADQRKLLRQQKQRERKKKRVIKIVSAAGVVIIFATAILNLQISNTSALETNNTLNNNIEITTSIDYTVPDEDICTVTSEITIEDQNVEHPIINIGTNQSINEVIDFCSSDKYTYYKEFGECYGIDPSIVVAIAMQESSLKHDECIPGGTRYNGFGVGMTQQEKPSGETVYAYNYVTNCNDKLACTMENACNEKSNVKLCFMRMQKKMDLYNGNLYMVIQSYNYGDGMMKALLNKMSKDTGKSVDEIKNDYTNLDWLEYVKDAHNNPSKYISGWRGKTYGDGDYLIHVASSLTEKKLNIAINGEMCQFDFTTGQFENESTKVRA